VYAISELPTNFGFFAASSAGCRSMRARQDSIHFPIAAEWSRPVRVSCDARKKQDSLHTPFR
jgi:hypothetical protein